jgi:hypothetical protein
MEGPAPANGLKFMVLILVLFALVAIYGQYQHARRAQDESAVVIPAPTTSPPAPNDKR